MTDDDVLQAEYAALVQQPAKARVDSKPDVAAIIPETNDLVELAKSATPALVRKAILMATESDKLHEVMSVLKELADRGYGKAHQSSEVKSTVDIVHNVGQNDRAIIDRFFKQNGAPQHD